MSGHRVSNEVILAKTEVTYGTDPVPVAATNAVLVRNPSWSQEGLRMQDRGAVRSSIGKLQKIYGGELRRISFEVELKGSGTAGTAPEIGPLLEACGMEETIVAVTSVTYKPESDAHESVTIYHYEFGRKLHILTGCRGTVTFRIEAGGIAVAAFEFVGHWTQPTDASQPSPTYNSQVPKPVLGLSATFNSVATLVIPSYEISLNNELAYNGSIAASDGYGPVTIANRDVMGSIVIESELDSVIDIDSLLVAGTRFAFSGGTIGSTAGNRLTISTPSSSTYITETSPGNSNGVAMRNVGFAVDDSTANQEVSIAFT